MEKPQKKQKKKTYEEVIAEYKKTQAMYEKQLELYGTTREKQLENRFRAWERQMDQRSKMNDNSMYICVAVSLVCILSGLVVPSVSPLAVYALFLSVIAIFIVCIDHLHGICVSNTLAGNIAKEIETFYSETPYVNEVTSTFMLSNLLFLVATYAVTFTALILSVMARV